MLSCQPLPLTPEEREALLAKLAKAEAVYESLMLGGGAKEFTDQNGEKIVYTAANAKQLLSWINMLRSRLGMCAWNPIPWARPAGVYL